MAGKLSIPGSLVAAVLLIVTALSAHAELPPAAVQPEEQDLTLFSEEDDVDRAIQRGLAWLVQRQDVTSGKFEGSPPNTVTALAAMALMATGHFEGRSPYGTHLQRAIMYLTRQAEQNPYLGSDGGRMYGHGIATLALCEAYGMMARAEDNLAIRNALLQAKQVILESQTVDGGHAGGWRYNPQPGQADLSVTAWHILNLRALQNCGFDVPQPAIDRAANYVRNVFRPGQGFAYQQGSGASPAMRAAGIVSMKVLGVDKDTEDIEKIEASASVFESVNPGTGSHFYYQSYYLATAANMMGEPYRTDFLPKLEEALLRLQNETGEFQKHTGHSGGVYSTAFAILSLAVRYQFLPIYQE